MSSTDVTTLPSIPFIAPATAANWPKKTRLSPISQVGMAPAFQHPFLLAGADQ